MADTILAANQYGERVIEVPIVFGEIDGLCVTKADGIQAKKMRCSYAVTHLQSGHAVCFVTTKALAKSVFAELLTMGDWKRSFDEMKADEPFFNAVRAFVNDRDGVMIETKRAPERGRS